MHSAVLIPEGKTDARWLQLMVKALELNPDGISDEAFSFAHEVGVIPTKDARVVDVFRHLNVIHPSLTCAVDGDAAGNDRSEEHTSELQSLMRNSYAVYCLKKKK